MNVSLRALLCGDREMDDQEGLDRAIDRARRGRPSRRPKRRGSRPFSRNNEFVCCLEPDGTLISANRAWCRYLGKRRRQVVGQTFVSFVAETERAEVQRQLDSLSPENLAASHEIRGTGLAGDGWQQWTFRATFDDRGNVVEYRATGQDVTHHKRTEEALELRLFQLAALSQASQAVTASLELDQVLAKIVSLASQVTSSDYTSVVLVDDRGNVGQTAEDLPGVPALEYRIRGNGLTSWIVRTRQAVFVDEIDENGCVLSNLGSGAPRTINPFLVEGGTRSVAGLPLMVKDRLLGVLYLHSLRSHVFRGQSFVLTAFANQVSIAIENARLFQAEEQQAQRLILLAQVARIVATILDVDEMLQALTQSVQSYFGCPIVALFTLDETERMLTLRGFSGAPEPLEVTTPGLYHQSIEVGILGHVARTGEPYISPDATADAYFVNHTEIPIGSSLCVPILDEGRVIGTLDVESERPAAFDNKDQALLRSVADAAAVGLRNARLYQRTRHHVQELRLLNNISAGFTLALNLTAMINGALEGLQELIKADRTAFVTIDTEARAWRRAYERTAPSIEPTTDAGGSLDDSWVELEAILSRQPVAVYDVSADPRVERTKEVYGSLGIQSVLLVPVQASGELCGALELAHCAEKHAWQPEEVRMLESVAHQLGLGLENVHLFEEVCLRADELAAALAQLEELDRLKDEFIQNVSHELRSPLALIRGYAELLDSGELGELDSEQGKSIDIIARRSRMLGSLVEDITLILEAEVSPPKPEAVLLDELAETAVGDFEVVAREAELTLRAEIVSHPALVSIPAVYLRRVLDNLLSNAVKFTPSGGTITLRVERDGECITLQVSDTGIGILPEKLERIFDRFYQVDGSARRKYGGVGLGLALVKELLEAYDGCVSVDSRVGEGSTFTITLPVARRKEQG